MKYFAITLLSISLAQARYNNSQLMYSVKSIGQLPPSTSEAYHLNKEAYNDAQNYYANQQPYPEYSNIQPSSSSILGKALLGGVAGGVIGAQCADNKNKADASLLLGIAGAITGAFIGAENESRKICNNTPAYREAKNKLDEQNKSRIEAYHQELFHKYYYNGNLNKNLQCAINLITAMDDFILVVCESVYDSNSLINQVAGKFYGNKYKYPFNQTKEQLVKTLNKTIKISNALLDILNQHDQLTAGQRQLIQVCFNNSNKIINQIENAINFLESDYRYLQEKQNKRTEELYLQKQKQFESYIEFQRDFAEFARSRGY